MLRAEVIGPDRPDAAFELANGMGRQGSAGVAGAEGDGAPEHEATETFRALGHTACRGGHSVRCTMTRPLLGNLAGRPCRPDLRPGDGTTGYSAHNIVDHREGPLFLLVVGEEPVKSREHPDHAITDSMVSPSSEGGSRPRWAAAAVPGACARSARDARHRRQRGRRSERARTSSARPRWSPARRGGARCCTRGRTYGRRRGRPR